MNKKFLTVSAAVIVAAMLFAGCRNSEKENALQQQIDSLALSDSLHQEDVKTMADFVNVMSVGLDSISAQEGIIVKNKNAEGRIDKTQLKAQLNSLSQLLKNQRARISELEKTVAGQNTSYAQKVKKLIAYYKQQLDEKDKQIADLQEQLNSKNADIEKLNESVNQLTTTNTELGQTIETQQNTINEQDNTIHEAYVAIGSYKDLKARGIAEGGFLKKKKVNVQDLNKANFQKVDVREYNDIKLNSESPKILSQMPAASYSITKNNDGTSTLHIKDANAFWSITKYLVVKL